MDALPICHSKMTKLATLSLERPAARKRDAEATQAAILEAAKSHFAKSGYDGAFLRDIAADAGVDAALINRYFGGKDGLFAAALKHSIRPHAFQEWDRKSFAHEIATMMAGHAHQDMERTHAFQFLLRAAAFFTSLRVSLRAPATRVSSVFGFFAGVVFAFAVRAFVVGIASFLRYFEWKKSPAV